MHHSKSQLDREVIEEGVHIPEICYLLLKYGVSLKFYHENLQWNVKNFQDHTRCMDIRL